MDRRINERINDHNKRDQNPLLSKLARETQYTYVWKGDFEIL